MAIEIISRGVPDSEKLAEFSCGDCRTTMRAKKSDGDYIFDQRDGDAIKFKCPVCKRDIWVNVKSFKIPDQITGRG